MHLHILDELCSTRTDETTFTLIKRTQCPPDATTTTMNQFLFCHSVVRCPFSPTIFRIIIIDELCVVCCHWQHIFIFYSKWKYKIMSLLVVAREINSFSFAFHFLFSALPSTAVDWNVEKIDSSQRLHDDGNQGRRKWRKNRRRMEMALRRPRLDKW